MYLYVSFIDVFSYNSYNKIMININVCLSQLEYLQILTTYAALK